MAGYIYQQADARRRAAREQLEAARAEWEEIQSINREADEMVREAHRIRAAIREASPNLYGGRKGLRAAAAEAAEYDRRKKGGQQCKDH